MQPSNYIIEVNEEDFEYEVLLYSQQIPVVVDFWAEWCGPCKMLGPLLERLAQEANGAFRLAKINVDENTNLAMRYNVRSIPAVKGFRDGQVVAEFLGAQPEPRVKQWLRELAPSHTDLALEKANSLLKDHDWAAASQVFQQVLKDNLNDPSALLGFGKCLMMTGKPEKALEILNRIPSGREFSKAQTLIPAAKALVNITEKDIVEDDLLEAAYAHSLRLAKRGNLEAALDGLLDILRQNKQFRNGEARKVIVALLDIFDEDDPIARQYRSELSMILF
ncbi:MAG: thioredoxin [Chloroflexi bacterium]|nr:MAG: thioredoxin [Chloroflexota bacterium]